MFDSKIAVEKICSEAWPYTLKLIGEERERTRKLNIDS